MYYHNNSKGKFGACFILKGGSIVYLESTDLRSKSFIENQKANCEFTDYWKCILVMLANTPQDHHKSHIWPKARSMQ